MNKRAFAAFAIAAVAALALGMTGCSSNGAGGDSADTTVFRVAFNQSPTHPQAEAILDLSDKLEEQTDGKYKLELFADGTLGSQEASIEQVQSGTIDLAFIAGSLLESFNPDFSVVNLPYIYESPEHQMEVLNDPEIVGDLYDTLLDQDIEILAAVHGGVRNVYSSKAVEKPADLAGQKIRVIGSPTNVRLMELMGGVGTPMAQDEVYTAMQSGVLDGGENNELIYGTMSHYEIAPVYSYTKHLMMPDYLVGNPKVIADMDEESREIFETLLDESVDVQLAAFDTAVSDAKKRAEEGGATFVETDVEAFKKEVLPLHKEMLTTETTQTIYDAIAAAK
ncbi:tripartite ATP-independent transporter DctP family solute receptor [Leucobacter exalbidus]|uniref:Tripartite ATP-independent transporter DctP family solute receptor n=1 Tax=Leucobacter exalbidus TaxID=662960 RepID=A0A940PU16_9MICO|nr:TRAP transporter substrate-binding protein [Leucobacter exalbidus]MBP1326803.1 tripartite ATP-independent transporter DctP family solute receptor [Leucobacter exalbidus]